MNLNNLYDLAEKEKIKIYDWHLEVILKNNKKDKEK